ncbi:hypothetical protein Avbf_16479 [Armadillidium vulgare]|nr:hypothetical protein Avbf_16479 [Armadillidium vulgare]
MDIKIKIDIKDELTVEEPHFSHHLNQVSDFEEIQEKTYYPNIRIKNDIEVKEEPFDFVDKNTSNVRQNFDTISGLDENEEHYFQGFNMLRRSHFSFPSEPFESCVSMS